MPELPEVETIVRRLREGNAAEGVLLGHRVLGVNVLWARTLRGADEATLQAQLPGQQLLSVGRRAKWVVMQFDNAALLLHLRMSGDLRVESQAAALQPHDRLLLDFEGGLRLTFNDPRKFGRAWWTQDPAAALADLGPEPLDEGLSDAVFYQRLHRVQRQLKPLLLDQRFLAGLGNIYTDEALHRAGLHPLRRSNTLTIEEAQRLLRAIRAALQEGIRRNGASIDWVYRGGNFQNYFRVYQRTGQPCPVCGTPIVRLLVGQRGTHICPVCQPAPDTPAEGV
ncbi:MAG: bifunctional DNA-formamidopyrimidine glycosylase/DNA-(apurinic or apyrimidinic site) lyase [Anaerolinea sp.]|nr:bifunctional DNA-formamidopyrimidine glycosylase/DNA-(apurinic or apyrimidinic site) lyase [Anaerolinea sp.]